MCVLHVFSQLIPLRQRAASCSARRMHYKELIFGQYPESSQKANTSSSYLVSKGFFFSFIPNPLSPITVPRGPERSTSLYLPHIHYSILATSACNLIRPTPSWRARSDRTAKHV